MSCKGRQNPRTASPELSIWRELSEDKFRQHLVALEERTNAVPIRPQIFPLVANHDPDWSTDATVPILSARILSIEAEQKLANDLAFIAAVGEGAQSVSAVCLEEHCKPPALIIRFAAVDTIEEHVQTTLRKIIDILPDPASNNKLVENSTAFPLTFNLIVQLNRQKILGRLRSAKWEKPKYLSRTHKKPLWQDFDNLVHRVQFIYPKKKDPRRNEIETQLNSLAQTIKDFEDTRSDTDAEFVSLLNLIHSCYTFCTSDGPQAYAELLESFANATPQIAASIKSLRQIEKLAAYHRISSDLIRISRQYPALFAQVNLEYLQPYHSIPTGICHESWARTLHVHAEVQLAVYYDTLRASLAHSTTNEPKSIITKFYHPRVIGTSKHLCYLCYLFLTHHGTFAPANTHGRLYDQWTIPDLQQYNQVLVRKYREIIQAIDNDVVNLTNELGPKRSGKRDAWRREPMTSRENLLLGSHDNRE